MTKNSGRVIGVWLFLGFVFVAFTMSGCAQSPTSPEVLTPDSLLSVPTSIVLDGKTLTLDTGLSRDFQPLVPAEGRPMLVVLQLRTDDGSAVPTTVAAESVWLVDGTDVWSGTPREERARQETGPIYETIARDGPKWTPGRLVDVVVQLRDGRGRRWRLRAAHRRIEASY